MLTLQTGDGMWWPLTTPDAVPLCACLALVLSTSAMLHSSVPSPTLCMLSLLHCYTSELVSQGPSFCVLIIAIGLTTHFGTRVSRFEVCRRKDGGRWRPPPSTGDIVLIHRNV